MKKLLLILGMITCMAGMSACGQKDEAASNPQEQAAMEEMAGGFITSIDQIVASGDIEGYAGDAVIYAALESYQTALEDMGGYRSVDDVEYTISDDGITIVAHLVGAERNASMEIIIDTSNQLVSATTNVERTFRELMINAALNTLLGMGTVFVVLILISLIISCFNLIPKIQKSFEKKKDTAKVKDTGVVAQIVQNEEQYSDDFELIAVISAAIAASEGSAGSDGYVVRSIRRVR